ncbi:MAG: fibronectin type III domain-containing protein [Aeromicrobium sp.]|uniref:hypothetical protein n=1 Tax=Aeromicrobium sp. TaxID=1871063 RepID=UPI0039E4185C
MSFDQRAYAEEVLRPLAKDSARLDALNQVLRALDAPKPKVEVAARLDLGELLGVDPSMSAAELGAHLRGVKKALNKNARLGSGPLLLTRLLDELGKFGQLDDPALWGALMAERGQALKGQLENFARMIAQDRPLKLLTIEEATELAANEGLSGVPQRDLVMALNAQGVEVRPDFEPPEDKPVKKIQDVTKHPEFRTIVDALVWSTSTAKPMAVRVVDELSFEENGRRTEISLSHVGTAAKELEKAARRFNAKTHQDVKDALSKVKLLGSQSELHQMALVSVMGQAESLLNSGRTKLSVRNHLVDLGLAEVDASRIVVKLSEAGQARGLADVTDKLVAGALDEARRLFDALPEMSEDEAVEKAQLGLRLEAAEKKKRDLLAEYEVARRRRDYAAAETALRGAMSVDVGDETLASRLAVLPPPPPGAVVARSAGQGVDITWSGAGAEARYTVVRSAGAIPVGPSDGDVLTTNITEGRFHDPRPLVGRSLHYAVFASKDGAHFSDPSVTTTTVLPAPSDLTASAGVTDVALSWSTPPQASGVVITEIAPDGSLREHRPSTPGQLSVSGLRTGTKYRFAATAVYLLPGGERRSSAPAEIDAIPRGLIRPVDDLRVESVEGGHRASWSTIIGYTVELWVFPVEEKLRPGLSLSNVDLAAKKGSRITLKPGPASDGRTVRDFDALPDVSRLVPVTVDGDGGLVGAAVIEGSAPPVRHPEVDRLGNELRLSWEWPEGNYNVEIAWTAAGQRRTREVTRTAYLREGGPRLPGADHVRELTLSTVVVYEGERWVFSPVRVALAEGGAVPVVGYSLSVKRSRLGGKGKAVVTVTAADFRGTLPLMVVLKEAKFMPRAVTDGHVAIGCSVDLGAGETPGAATFEVDFGKVVPPFWVRVFADEGAKVRLEDPPTSQMKGS